VTCKKAVCRYVQFNGTEGGRTPFMVKNKLFRFEYWVELMRRRPVALSATAPVADLYFGEGVDGDQNEGGSCVTRNQSERHTSNKFSPTGCPR
jgi:hypothetical protein